MGDHGTAERWFTDDELREMTRPTMDCAIEAVDDGELDRAKDLCEREKHEAQFMHRARSSMDRIEVS